MPYPYEESLGKGAELDLKRPCIVVVACSHRKTEPLVATSSECKTEWMVLIKGLEALVINWWAHNVSGICPVMAATQYLSCACDALLGYINPV